LLSIGAVRLFFLYRLRYSELIAIVLN